MPMSTSRAAFYAQQYFPAKYYRDLYEITLEEAKDAQEAREELQKLLIDADTNLSRLSDTFRIRQPSFGQELQTRDDKELLAKEGKDAEAGAEALRKLEATAKAEARTAINLALQKAKEQFGPVGRNTALYADTVAAAAKGAMSPYGKRPALQRAIFIAIADEFGQSEGLLNAGRTVLNDASLDYNKIREAANSPEDKAALAALKNATAGEGATTPAGEAAQARLDAMASPFANASTEQTNRVAAGLESDEEDALLRLYLSRLQDKTSPGEVTDDEIAAEPRLAEAEAVYEKVRAKNSYQKSAAKWYAAEYLSALRTKSNLEKKAATDPFQGLSPQEWAAREAFDRGGYTAEEVHYLDALANNPKRAELVRPAYKRAREGLEPKTELEKVIAAAYEMDQDLPIDAIEGMIAKEQKRIRQATRQAIRTGAVVDKAGARKSAREEARELTPEDIATAQAYLVALKLPPNQVAPGIAAPPPSKRPELPADKAGAAVDRAEEEAEAPPAPPAPTPEGGGAASPPTPEGEGEGDGDVPTDEDFEREVARRVDPTDPRFAYELTPSGDSYIVYKDGVLQTTPARKGTRAFSSITSVLGGGPALTPTRRTGTTGDSQDSSTVTSAVTSSVDEALGRKPVQKIDLGVSDRPALPLPEAAPAPAPAAPAPTPAAPAPTPKTRVKVVKDPVTGRFIEVEE